MTQYQIDYYAWTQEQSRLLREGKFHQLDLQNLAEEIESLGRQEFKELVSRLRVLIAHLLKWDYQPEKQTRSWRATINIQRKEIKRLLEDNPSLKPRIEEAFAKHARSAIERGFEVAVELAAVETGLPDKVFPTVCPYGVEEILESPREIEE